MPIREEIEATIRRQKAAQDQALLIKSSFPSRLHDVLRTAPVHTYSNTGSKLASQCQKHVATIEALKKDAKSGIVALESAFANADDPDSYANVFQTIASSECDKAALAQDAVALCRKSVELADAVRDELAPLFEQLRNAAELKVKELREHLEMLGFGPDQNPMAGRATQVLKRQFDFYVRRNNCFLREDLQAADQARSEHGAAVQQSSRKRATLEQAKQLLHQVAVEAINS